MLGAISEDNTLVVSRAENETPAVDMPMEVLLSKAPHMHRTVEHVEKTLPEFKAEGIDLAQGC